MATPAPSPDVSPYAATPPSKPRPILLPATFPVRDSTIGLDEEIEMAPTSGGRLYVSVPSQEGIVIALLGPTGLPARGWPLRLVGQSRCSGPMPAADASVRILCPAGDQGSRASAIDARGKMLPGWPIDLPVPDRGWISPARVIGNRLVVVAEDPLHIGSWLMTVEPDGTTAAGAQARASGPWSIGPDGTAYSVTTPRSTDEQPEVSEIVALDRSGIRASWPVRIRGVASPPAFGPDGRIYLTVGSFTDEVTRVVILEPDGGTVASSTSVPMATTAVSPGEATTLPGPPLVAEDGTAFLGGWTGDVDAGAILYALVPSGGVVPGWPRSPCPESGATSSLGAGPVLYVTCVGPWQSPDEPHPAPIGGSLVALGADGSVRAGWPLVLTHANSDVRSTVVAPGGTVHAVAIEQEPDGSHQAAVLGITPGGAIRSRTTVATGASYYQRPPYT